MRFIIAIVLIFISIGCSNNSDIEEITQVEQNRVKDISFTDKHGRVTIIYNESHVIDFVVWMKDLDTDEGYEIALVRSDGKGGVVFGPEENLEIKLGRIEEQTKLYPNNEGELYVSMLNPERMFIGAEEVRMIVRTIDQKAVIESFPFRF